MMNGRLLKENILVLALACRVMRSCVIMIGKSRFGKF